MEVTLITFNDGPRDPAILTGHVSQERLAAFIDKNYTDPDGNTSPRLERRGPGFWWIYFDVRGEQPARRPGAYARHTGTIAAPSI